MLQVVSYFSTLFLPANGLNLLVGVAAQLLQKETEIEASHVEEMITCDACENQIHLNVLDTISRNLLLQVPTTESIICSFGEGCGSECNQHGICLPQYVGSDVETCHCDVKWYGDDCSANRDPGKLYL